MKKLVCMMIAVLMLFAVAAAEPVCSSVEVDVYFNGDSNVRSGPSLNDRGFDVAKKESTLAFLFDVSVDERGVAWYYVTNGEREGWVSSRYSELMTAEGHKLTAVTEDTMPLFFDLMTVYSAPVEDEAFVLLQADAEEAEVEFMGLVYEDENENSWYCVRVGECEGWANESCMELQYN